jgi:inhibitor of KinA
MLRFDVLSAGDSAILVQMEQRIDPELNGWCIQLARALEQRLGSSVLDVVIGFCSVTTYFDPLQVEPKWLEREVRTIAAAITNVAADAGGLIEVPVCYGGEFGPDLAEVARFGSCSESEVIDIHTARTYRVYLVGFVPGFAYLAEVDRRIAVPRRPAPRTAVPAGSVAIAGGQTGVYPSVTPGGWNIIGRTPIKPYDATRPEPFLFKPGDRVQFRRISQDEFRSVG